MIEIKVHQLLNAGYDLSESYMVDVPEFQDTEFQVLPGQKLEIEIHKIQDGLSLSLPAQKIKGLVTCARTLEEFEYSHNILSFEMQAYTKIPEDIDPEDVLQINTKNMTLDIEPFIREGVFISLPYRFIKEDTSIKQVYKVQKDSASSSKDAQSFQPFANLKDLL